MILLQQDYELLTATPERKFLVIQNTSHAICRSFQNKVAGQVAVSFVYLPEVIKIEHY